MIETLIITGKEDPLIMQQYTEIYTISHYQRGCFYIFQTRFLTDHKNIVKLTGSTLLFQYLCAQCQIIHVTPDRTTHANKLKTII